MGEKNALVCIGRDGCSKSGAGGGEMSADGETLDVLTFASAKWQADRPRSSTCALASPVPPPCQWHLGGQAQHSTTSWRPTGTRFCAGCWEGLTRKSRIWGAAGLSDSGPFLHTGVDVSWELLGVEPEWLGCGTVDALFQEGRHMLT